MPVRVSSNPDQAEAYRMISRKIPKSTGIFLIYHETSRRDNYSLRVSLLLPDPPSLFRENKKIITENRIFTIDLTL